MFYNRIKEYPVEYLLLAITICLQFYRLGMGEIQPWDEALYCVRANACLQFGVWLDQTQYAVGGLYSSTHPPLLIWLMVVFVKLLGQSELVLRLPSAIFASVGVLIMYLIVQLYSTKRTALLSAIIFGNAQVYLWYGHHAQLDIPMHVLVLSALYFFLKFTKGQSKKGHIIAGIFLGFALLSKAFQALYILPFILLYSTTLKAPRRFWPFLIMATAALVVSSWWYIMMAMSHPEFLVDYSAIFRKIASGTYHTSQNNWWYYINQLVIALPFVVILIGIGQRRFLNNYSKSIFYASLLWLGSLLVLLSVVSTKMPHFILFLLISSVLVVSFAIESIINRKVFTITELSLMIALPLCTLWSISPQIRNLMTVRAGLYAYPSWQIVFFLLPLAAITVWEMRQKGTIYYKILLLCLCIVVEANMYRWSSRNESSYRDGAETVAKYLDSLSHTRIIVLHADYPFEDLQPQLAYYTNGWTLGWHQDRKYMTLPFKQFIGLVSPDCVVVISKYWNAFNKPNTEDSIMLSRIYSQLVPLAKTHFTTSRYEVFAFQ